MFPNNDGCVDAANSIAKQIDPGIMFRPYFQVKTWAQAMGVAVRSSNHELYGAVSNRIAEITSRFSAWQEVYSIDESFVGLLGTVVGFFAGAYIALGLFPDAVREVASAMPFAHSAMLLRIEFAGEPLFDLVGGQPQAIDELSLMYGLSLEVGSWVIPIWFPVLMLAAMAVIFTVLGSARIRSRIT